MTQPDSNPTPAMVSSPDETAQADGEGHDPSTPAPQARLARLVRENKRLKKALKDHRAQGAADGLAVSDDETGRLKGEIESLQQALDLEKRCSLLRLAAFQLGAADPEDVVNALAGELVEQSAEEAVTALRSRKPHWFTGRGPTGMPGHPAAAPGAGPLAAAAARLRERGDTLGLLRLAQDTL